MMSNLLRAASLTSLTSLIIATGCVTNDDAAPTSESTHAITSGTCPPYWCGSGNSPEIDHLGMHELNVDGRPNANDFTLKPESKHPNGYLYKIRVEAAQVFADCAPSNPKCPDINYFTGNPYDGKGLDDLPLIVNHPSGSIYELRVLQEIPRTFFFARPNPASPIQTHGYYLSWDVYRPPGSKRQWKNICKAPPSDNTDTLGLDRLAVVLFEKDRVDPVSMTFKGVEDGWFNIGCATHALAKLHLTGHTEAAAKTAPELTTSLPERTAMLKMLAADYCGNGTPLTVAGVPLKWQDEYGWMHFGVSVTLEAMWTEKGASCINTPRIAANPPALNPFPNIEDDIKAACGGKRPPSCAGMPLSGHVFSGNP